MFMNAAVVFTQDTRSGVKDFFLVLGAVFLIALSGQIALPLPFTPVPIALQSHVCMLMAVLLGRRLGVVSVAAFLFLGAMGLPIFSMGGAGLPILMGPRGGYLMGYLAAVYVIEKIIERKHLTTPRQKILAMGVGNLVIYLFGLAQLSLFVGIERVMMLGMLPFLAGDLFKLFLSYRLLKKYDPSSDSQAA
jgi:biotin transport system substrate-specific component